MPFRIDVVGSYEETLHILGDSIDILDRTLLGDLLHELFAVKTSLLGDLAKKWMHLEQFLPIQHLSQERNCENGLNSAGCSRNDANGSGGSYSGGACITHVGCFRTVVNGTGIVGEITPLFGQIRGSDRGFLLDKGHDLFGHFNCFLGIVWNTKENQQVGKSHHSQADFPVGFRHLLNLRQGVTIHFDDIVQKMHTSPNDVSKFIEIQVAVFRHPGQIDGGQIAGFVGQQRLFAAGIGGFDLSDLRRGIVPVNAIEKDDPWLAVLPGGIDDLFKYLPRWQSLGPLSRAGINEIVLPVFLHSLHEFIGYCHRDVEVI